MVCANIPVCHHLVCDVRMKLGENQAHLSMYRAIYDRSSAVYIKVNKITKLYYLSILANDFHKTPENKNDNKLNYKTAGSFQRRH